MNNRDNDEGKELCDGYFMLVIPDWLKKENDNVFSMMNIVLMEWKDADGKHFSQNIDNYLDELFGKTDSPDDIARVKQLLVEHKIITLDNK